MGQTRRRLWLGCSLALAACGSGRLQVDVDPGLALPVEIARSGPHFYVVNDYPGMAEVYLVTNGSRVLVARVNGGEASLVPVPAAFVGRVARVLIQPGLGPPAQTSREITFFPDRHLEVRASPSRLCIRAWSGKDVCP